MLSRDEMSEIMIHMDVEDLHYLCITNTNFNNLCHDAYFWKKKLMHDQLPVYDDPTSIIDYEKIKYANDKVLLYKFKNYLVMTLNNDLSMILPENSYKKYDYAKLYFHLLETNYASPYISYVSYVNGKPIEMRKINLSKNELLDIIFKVFYHYPNVKISNF